MLYLNRHMPGYTVPWFFFRISIHEPRMDRISKSVKLIILCNVQKILVNFEDIMKVIQEEVLNVDGLLNCVRLDRIVFA